MVVTLSYISAAEYRLILPIFIRKSQDCLSISQATLKRSLIRDDVIKWRHFLRYWPFVRGIHRSPVDSPHKGQWHGPLIYFVYSTVYLHADQRKYKSSASLAFVQGIPPSPVNFPHIGPVTRKMFPLDDVIMNCSDWPYQFLLNQKH